jgi:hypothetical protein
MSKHTKEPWAKGQEINISGKALNISLLLGSSSTERVSEARDNLERMRACVNAMAGIDDPAAARQAFDAAADMLAALKAAVADNSIVEGSDWWGLVFSAIAKAEASPLLSRIGGGE